MKSNFYSLIVISICMFLAVDKCFGQLVNYTPLFDQTTFAQQTIDLSLPVGVLPGSSSVSASGAATYTIPIEMAPGTNGLVPEISLQYNSQAGNGIAGYGWSIAGLSAIGNSTRTIYHYFYK